MRVAKLTDQIFDMKPTCIVPNINETKDEWLIIYRKTNKSLDDSALDNEVEILTYPYYACRIQAENIDNRFQDLKLMYSDIVELARYKVPNAVNFFNFMINEMKDCINRGRGKNIQSFGIINKHIDEDKMLKLIANMYRNKNYNKL